MLHVHEYFLKLHYMLNIHLHLTFNTPLILQALICISVQFSHSVFATLQTAALQSSLSITNSRSLLKLMSIELVMPSNHPLPSPSLPTFNLSQNQGLFQWVSSWWSGQSIGASASASVCPVNIQGLFPLGLTGLISLLSKRLSRVFSRTTIEKQIADGTT